MTTFQDETVFMGAMNETSSGATYVLLCAAGAAFGLLVRARQLARTCGVIAALLTVMIAYESPGAMMQFGYQASLAWGAYLALASSVALVVATRRRVAREWVEFEPLR